MSIYYQERAQYFNQAMCSIWQEQTIKPTEIVLVQDGKLTDELYSAIDEWSFKLGEVLKIVTLKENLGTGDAKNAGLKQCTQELVVIMDTDDICLPDRFEKQLNIFNNYDVDACGGWISEFHTDENRIASYRRVPEAHHEVVKLSKKRMPVNHVTLMCKKEIMLKAGGYQKMLWLEDYYLVVRMILAGAKFYNIQSTLVNVRSGFEQLQRRSGIRYALSELQLQQEFLRLKFISHIEFFINVIVRFSIRIMPRVFIGIVYRRLRKL